MPAGMTGPRFIFLHDLKKSRHIRGGPPGRGEILVVGTFSDKGPAKCSMLDVHRYTEEELQQQLAMDFEKINCLTETI
jgi:hypothetical protein